MKQPVAGTLRVILMGEIVRRNDLGKVSSINGGGTASPPSTPPPDLCNE